MARDRNRGQPIKKNTIKISIQLTGEIKRKANPLKSEKGYTHQN